MISRRISRRNAVPSLCLTALATLAGVLGGAGCNKVPLLAPTGSSITLTALATALPVNGSTSLIAQVLEAAGTPPQDGTLVTFTTTLGTIDPPQAETLGGRVTVKFLSGTQSGTALIRAFSGAAASGATSTGAAAGSSTTGTEIKIGAAAVGSVSISSNLTTLPATGGTATITAAVFDSGGNFLSGAPVTFTTDNGVLSSTTVTSDSNGKAQTSLTTTRTAKVTASAGVAAGTTGAPSGSVTIGVNIAAAVTVGSPSPASPTVGQAVTFPLTITTNAAGSAVQRVTVDFGDGSGTQTFPPATTGVSHTYLSTGTFAVRVTVVDGAGDVGTGSASVTVGARPQPAVTITAPTTTPTVGTDATFTVSITPAAGTGTVIQSATVDFGDGTQTSLGAATGTFALHHVYTTKGTFTVQLTATDSNGGVGVGTTTVFVQDAVPLTVLLSAVRTPSGPNTIVTFTATVIGLGNSVVVKYDWDFGPQGLDTSASNVQTRTYVTATTATFIAKVHVTTSLNLTADAQVSVPIP